MPMNETVKAEWLKALRSGEYEQGRNVLASVDDDGNVSYCCLGVLCDLAVKAGLDITVETPAWGLRIQYDDAYLYPPDSVVQWAGLDDSNPLVGPNDYDDRLGGFNDGYDHGIDGVRAPYDFHQIADLIEAHL